MGYIFDALNKQSGKTAEDQPAPAQELDTQPAPESDANVLADLMAQADEQSQADNTPLRLSDIELSIATNDAGQTVVGTDRDQQTIEISDAILADEAEELAEPIVTQDLSIDQPLQQIGKKKVSLWSRLLGRHFRGKVDDRLVAITSPASPMSEEYRSIRTSILARHDNERHVVHTITSATPQEGKTITCVNLGLSFAELRNRKTIIIECDLRLPTFGKLLNCDTDRPGLINYLRGDAKINEIIQQVEGSELHIIAAGGMVSDEAVQLLSSQRMSNLIQGLRAKYDHVIIDTPPVLQLADAGILGSQSEEVLVVARMRRTPRPLVEQAINTLTSYNAQVSGIIATDNPRSRGRGYGYKYGYRYGYSYGYTSSRHNKKLKQREAA
jgi:capsular exopolysaccharide synthesis family protein